jgi:TPR repeat protein
MRQPIVIAIAAALLATASGLAISSTEEAGLQRAVEAGAPGAAAELASRYEQRNLIAASREVLVEAAEAGDPAAILLLAEHDVTHGAPHEVEAALPVVRGLLPTIVAEDRTRIGLRLADRVLDPSVSPGTQRQWARVVVDLLAPARQAGDSEALWRIGYLASLGLPSGQNPESASATIARAADAGHPAAAYWLARHNFDGIYAPRDVHQGVRYLEVAAIAGHRNAMLELGTYYAPLDSTLSRFWTTAAAERQGRLTPVDPSSIPRRPEVRTNITRAPAQAPAKTEAAFTAQLARGMMVAAVNHRSIDAAALVPAASDGALESAQARIRELTLDVERLSAENTDLRTKLADLQARYNALAQQRESAAYAAAARNQQGMQHYAAGDYESALSAFRAGVDADYAPAMTNLAILYLNGHGVPQSLTQTEALLKRASALGDVNASENLARLYRFGLGFHRDPSRAITWYEKAIAQGSTSAPAELNELKQSM